VVIVPVVAYMGALVLNVSLNDFSCAVGQDTPSLADSPGHMEKCQALMDFSHVVGDQHAACRECIRLCFGFF
jgi:hypothetical protein